LRHAGRQIVPPQVRLKFRSLMGDKEKVDGNAIIIWRFLSTSGYLQTVN